MARTSCNSLDYECIATTFTLGFFKALGLAPFSVQKSSKKLSKKKPRRGSGHMKFVVSRLGCFYNILLIAVQFRMLFISMPLGYDVDYPDKTSLTSTIVAAESVIGNVVLLVIWLIFGFRQKTVVNFLNRLMSFRGVTLYRREDNFSFGRRFFILVFLTNIFGWTVLLCTEQLAYHAWVLSWFNVLVPSYVLSWFVIPYIFAVKLIEKEFRALNRTLFEKSVNSSVGFENRLSSVRDLPINHSHVPKIKTIRRAHTHLYEIAMEISDFYSLPILLTIAYFSYITIFVSYYLVMPFVITSEEQTYLMIVNSIFTIMSVMLPIAVLASGITDATKEIKNTADVIRSLMIRSTTSRHDIHELKHFAIELLDRKIEFTACGLFPLDCTLLHSIFSMVVTYLVILIQFHMMNSGNTSDHETE